MIQARRTLQAILLGVLLLGCGSPDTDSLDNHDILADELGGLVCGKGTELVGNECQPAPCGEGTTLRDGLCEPTVKCPQGQGWNPVSESCENQSPRMCGEGTLEVDGHCVPDPASYCGEGTLWNEAAGMCLPMDGCRDELSFNGGCVSVIGSVEPDDPFHGGVANRVELTSSPIAVAGTLSEGSGPEYDEYRFDAAADELIQVTTVPVDDQVPGFVLYSREHGWERASHQAVVDRFFHIPADGEYALRLLPTDVDALGYAAVIERAGQHEEPSAVSLPFSDDLDVSAGPAVLKFQAPASGVVAVEQSYALKSLPVNPLALTFRVNGSPRSTVNLLPRDYALPVQTGDWVELALDPYRFLGPPFAVSLRLSEVHPLTSRLEVSAGEEVTLELPPAGSEAHFLIEARTDGLLTLDSIPGADDGEPPEIRRLVKGDGRVSRTGPSWVEEGDQILLSASASASGDLIELRVDAPDSSPALFPGSSPTYIEVSRPSATFYPSAAVPGHHDPLSGVGQHVMKGLVLHTEAPHQLLSVFETIPGGRLGECGLGNQPSSRQRLAEALFPCLLRGESEWTWDYKLQKLDLGYFSSYYGVTPLDSQSDPAPVGTSAVPAQEIPTVLRSQSLHRFVATRDFEGPPLSSNERVVIAGTNLRVDGVEAPAEAFLDASIPASVSAGDLDDIGIVARLPYQTAPSEQAVTADTAIDENNLGVLTPEAPLWAFGDTRRLCIALTLPAGLEEDSLLWFAVLTQSETVVWTSTTVGNVPLKRWGWKSGPLAAGDHVFCFRLGEDSPWVFMAALGFEETLEW